MAERRYRLRPGWGALIGGIVFFGIGAVFFGYQATTNQARLVINGIFDLDPGGARIFYGVMGVVSAGFVGLAVLAIVRLAGSKMEVIVDDEAITIPRALRAPVRMAFAEITEVKIQTVQKQEFLTIAAGARKASITKAYLTEAEYDEVRRLVREKLQR